MIFSYFWDSYFLSYGKFVEFIMKLHVQALRSACQRRAWNLAIGRRCIITLLGVTAGKASHNASNAMGVTAGEMGHNSGYYNWQIFPTFKQTERRNLQKARAQWHIKKKYFKMSYLLGFLGIPSRQ